MKKFLGIGRLVSSIVFQVPSTCVCGGAKIDEGFVLIISCLVPLGLWGLIDSKNQGKHSPHVSKQLPVKSVAFLIYEKGYVVYGHSLFSPHMGRHLMMKKIVQLKTLYVDEAESWKFLIVLSLLSSISNIVTFCSMQLPAGPWLL